MTGLHLVVTVIIDVAFTAVVPETLWALLDLQRKEH